MTTRAKYDVERIKASVPFAELAGSMLGELQRCSGHFVVCCPFVPEKTPSFHVYGDHGHCFGCSWHGDVFAFYQALKGCSFPEAAEALAGLAGICPTEQGTAGGGTLFTGRYRVTDAEGGGAAGGPLARVEHPEFRRLRKSEIEALARLRGLSPLAIRAAAEDFGRVGYCDWPQWRGKRDGRWMKAQDAGPAWVVTDSSRYVVQYRRMDGQEYLIRNRETGKESFLKAWTKGSSRWPIGAAEIGNRVAVAFCEGGADMLAAYHFLWGLGILERVAVVCMFGGSNRMAEESLGYFKGKRVRVFAHADIAKDAGDGKTPRAPGQDAGLRWQKQLTAAGAAVEAFSFYGLTRADGVRVKDLNDMALCSPEVLEELAEEAFFDWDF